MTTSKKIIVGVVGAIIAVVLALMLSTSGSKDSLGAQVQNDVFWFSSGIKLGTVGNGATIASTNGHLTLSSAVSPTVSSCGTGPVIAGTDTSGRITVGTGATSCTLTFGRAYTTAPYCTVDNSNASATQPFTFTVSATSTILSQPAGLGGNIVFYQCFQ